MYYQSLRLSIHLTVWYTLQTLIIFRLIWDVVDNIKYTVKYPWNEQQQQTSRKYCTLYLWRWMQTYVQKQHNFLLLIARHNNILNKCNAHAVIYHCITHMYTSMQCLNTCIIDLYRYIFNLWKFEINITALISVWLWCKLYTAWFIWSFYSNDIYKNLVKS